VEKGTKLHDHTDLREHADILREVEWPSLATANFQEDVTQAENKSSVLEEDMHAEQFWLARDTCDKSDNQIIGQIYNVSSGQHYAFLRS
jgi:hypothetical protein